MRARHGEPVAWLMAAVGEETDDCLLWPFCTKPRAGHGQVRYQGPVRLVSHVVLELTGRPRPQAPGNHALHSCPGGGTPNCVNPRHLRWGTNAENIADRVAAGRSNPPSGARAPAAKLTEEDVRNIRDRHMPGVRGDTTRGNTMQLAAEYGVTRTTILNVVHRTWWAQS